MAVVKQSHPNTSELFAFANGTLGADRVEMVERHVANCNQCCERMLQAPTDSLEQRLLSPTETLANQYDPHQATIFSQSGSFPQSVDDDLSEEAALRSRGGGSDAVELPPTDDGAIPAALLDHPRYEVEQRLGKGGMGVVYKAKHRMMDRVVALKVINSTLVRRPDALERFRREVKAAARLQHRNIVTAHDAEHTDDLHFLVMEYVEGADLAKVVAQHGRLPIKLSCHYMRQAALGLQHAHEQGMIHRDIKPQNLVVTKEGQLKILDFGLARFAREQMDEPESEGHVPSGEELMSRTAHSLTLPGSVVGTPDYIAPEQATDSRNIDIRADIYSLGCTFYYLLSGRAPFDGHSVLGKLLQHRDATPPDITELREDIPHAVVEVVERMMAKSPDDRFATPGEIADALAIVMKALKDPATSQFVRNSAVAVPTPRTTAETDEADAATIVNRPTATSKRPVADKPKSHKSASVSRPRIPAPVDEWDDDEWDDEVGFEDTEFESRPRRSKSKGSRGKRNKKLRRNILIASATALLVATTAVGGMLIFNSSDNEDRGGSTGANAVPQSGQKRVVIVAPSSGVWIKDLDPLKRKLHEQGVFVKVASTSTEDARNVDTGKRNIPVDMLVTSVHPQDWDAVVFVGFEVDEFTSDAKVKEHVFQLIREMNKKKDKFLGGVCAGTAVLAKSGILTCRAVAWSHFAEKKGMNKKHTDRWEFEKGVVVDNRLITAKSDQYVDQFATKLVSMLNTQK